MSLTTREEARQAVQSAFGLVPNLLEELTVSPATTQAYLEHGAALGGGRLTAAEGNLIAVAISRENGCDYCQAAHGTVGKGAGLDDAALRSVLAGELPDDERLAALVDATLQLQRAKGHLSAEQQQALADRGVDKATLYEIVGWISLKTLANYVHHLSGVEIDAPFQDVLAPAAS